jgi:hypothetical protein
MVSKRASMKPPVVDVRSWPNAGTGQRRLPSQFTAMKPLVAQAATVARMQADGGSLLLDCENPMAPPSPGAGRPRASTQTVRRPAR